MKILVIILGTLCLIGFSIWAIISFMKNYENKSKAKVISGIIASVFACISLGVLILVPASIHQVNAGQVAVVKIWGEAKEVRTSGIYFDNWISHKYEIYPNQNAKNPSLPLHKPYYPPQAAAAPEKPSHTPGYAYHDHCWNTSAPA